MTDVQGKKFINLTGLHLFWQNVIKPKFDALATAVDNHGTQLSTLSDNKADKSRFDNFNDVEGKTIEKVIEEIQIAASQAGVTSIAAAEPVDGALVKVGISGVESQPESGIYQGAIIVSIDETALNVKFGAIEGAINGKAAQGDLDDAVERITIAEGKITTAEGQIATLEGAISGEGGINGEIASLKSSKADKTALETLSQTVTTLGNNAATKAELNEHIEAANKKFDEKADQTDLDTLSDIVGGKANQGDLEALTQTVGTKAAQADLEALSDIVDNKANSSTVTELTQTVGTKAAQADLEALTQTVGTKAAQADLDTANGKIKTNADNITALQTAVEALSSATDFIGVTTTEIFDGSTTNPVKINEQDYTAVKGDIVINSNKEFIWDGAKWVELGDTTALAQDVETLKTAAETNANTALLVSEVEAAFNAGWV